MDSCTDTALDAQFNGLTNTDFITIAREVTHISGEQAVFSGTSNRLPSLSICVRDMGSTAG